MIIKLHTEIYFDSAHYLRGYDGKCKNVHGHIWRVRVWIMGDESKKDEIGILFDFGKLKTIHEKLDHQILNEISPFDKINPTAENISRWVYNQLKEDDSDLMFKVRLYETSIPKETYCEYGDF